MSEPNVNVLKAPVRSRTNVRTLTSMAMLTALAYVVMLLSKMLPQVQHFLQMGVIADQRRIVTGMDYNGDPACLREHCSCDHVLEYVADYAGALAQGDLLRIQLCPANELLQMCDGVGNDLQFPAPHPLRIQQLGAPFNFGKVIFQRMAYIVGIALKHLAAAAPVVHFPAEAQTPDPFTECVVKAVKQNEYDNEQVELP